MPKHVLTEDKKAGTHNAKIIIVMVFCICVCLSFVAGFLVRGDQNILEALGFSALVTEKEDAQATDADNTQTSLSARMAEVEAIIRNDSLDDYDVNQLTPLIMKTFTEENSDAYLRYYDQDRYTNYVKESSGTYAGIGVLFSEYNGQAYVVDVFPESVAESAGIKVGDFVVAIDGDSSQDWTLTEAVNAVSQDEGESIVITWRRPATLDATGGEQFTTTLECHKYKEPNVVTELHDGVGYIKLSQITQNSASLTKSAIDSLTAQGAASFVLDIRDNPGGYLTQSVDIASLFVKSGVIVGMQTKEEQNSTKTATGSVATDKPMVLLINENTAAAAEVLAAALKDNERATIVGHTTLGKGSVQVVKALSFGGALRYTAAYYTSPLGHEINGVGVTPDIVVDMGAAADTDDQKSLALEAAQSQING
ncbi:MAG: S41 family peptidase [Raoultibacter sp.]